MLNRRIRLGRALPHEPDLLVRGDNLDLLVDVAEASVDLIYIDPPFGTGRTLRGRRRAADAASDGETPSKSRFQDVSGDPDRFVSWLWPCLEHSRRVLRAEGSLFVHLDYRTVHYVKVALDRLFGRQRFINEVIWCYSVGGRSGRAFGRKHDTILWYARGPEYVFFPDEVRIPRRPGSHMRVSRDAGGQPVQEKTDRATGKVYRYPVAAGKVPEDWWTDVETLNRGAAERTGWPTQKPERLVERLVRAASAEGGIVADWFCGSGTTAVVAQRLGRRFVTVDIEAEAIACAAERLTESGRELSRLGQPPPDIAVRDAAPQRAEAR